jgi:hypothetical protein
LKVPVARIPFPWNVSFPQENLPETLRGVDRAIVIRHWPREEMNGSACPVWTTTDRTSCEDVAAGRAGVIPWMISASAARFKYRRTTCPGACCHVEAPPATMGNTSPSLMLPVTLIFAVPLWSVTAGGATGETDALGDVEGEMLGTTGGLEPEHAPANNTAATATGRKRVPMARAS